ncbi:Muskelin N-terminus-domain-containing protein [Rhodocollybia butyracea]|uniref:Muskelin N-terminus-domain-containing protein n=1 Tax=Rhodocollybia butyracea TaxID=206335 RepID=A0A9P5Q4Y3_9AGAR|nr:Muskelin N-terminus-domain-containing protein [Rhodocollybia butyracea]
MGSPSDLIPSMIKTHAETIGFTVDSCSSYSTHFYPSNILIDDPSDSKSRWTTQNPESQHWILLRLDKLAVLQCITFGKFHNTHPCNMKEFKVYIGLTSENMTEILHSSLKNNSSRETFSLRHQNSSGLYFPTRFIKIEPLSGYGERFNISIWHVAIMGIVNEASVEEVKNEYNEFRETRVMHHILKHLRQRRLLSPYNIILSRSGTQLEHPLVTELYNNIVLRSDWIECEKLLGDISTAGLFDQFFKSSRPVASWQEIRDTDANGEYPSARGGHAMCIDPQREYIYLFGGWDGQKSLDDFWRYDIRERRWVLLSANTSLILNAPGPRSCHKMAYDSVTNSIYVLGRLDDLDRPTQSGPGGIIPRDHRPSTADQTPTISSRPIPLSEFYRYHCEDNKWEHLDIGVTGPRPIFDHQMVIDSDAQILYVFGGRTAEGNFEPSGLYNYHIHTKKWTLLQPRNKPIPSRFGHSMVLEPTTHQLYIFAGELEKDEKVLSDMHVYDIATNTATEIFSDFTSARGPQPCFTQRAVIDPTLQEIYILGGLMRDRETMCDSAPWLYRYHPRPGVWEKIQSTEDTHREQSQSIPSSRFAHQMVYEPISKMVYLHGGTVLTANAKQRDTIDGHPEEDPLRRLSDFWKMKLKRLTSDEVIRRSAYLIRQQRFKEMCGTQPAVQSLIYLQNQVSEVVNHDDPDETQLFRSLLTHLLVHSSPISPPSPSSGHNDLASSSLMVSPDSSPIKVDRLELLSTDPGSLLATPPPTAAPTWSEPGKEVNQAQAPQSDKLQAGEDPFERMLHLTEESVSDECFAQRTKTFEAILEFVNANAKQPAGSLLDLVDVDVDLV